MTGLLSSVSGKLKAHQKKGKAVKEANKEPTVSVDHLPAAHIVKVTDDEKEDLKAQLRAALEDLELETQYNGTVQSRVQLLEKAKTHVEQKAQVLKHELEATTANNEQLAAKVEEVVQSAHSLEAKTKQLEDELLKNKDALLAREQELAELNAAHEAETAALARRLEEERRERASERQLLQDKVQLLEVENKHQKEKLDDEQQLFLKKMEELKQEVSQLLTGFFRNEVDEEEVADRLKQLGCDVQLVEAPATPDNGAAPARPSSPTGSLASHEPIIDPEWAFQPKLVLDCPDRMQRLVAACMRSTSMNARSESTPLQPMSSTLNRLPSMGHQPAAAKPQAAPKLMEGEATPAAPSTPAPAPAPTIKSRNIVPSITIGHGGPQLVISANAQPSAKPAAGGFGGFFRSLSQNTSRSATAAPSTAPQLPEVTMTHQADSDAQFPMSTDLARAM